MFRRILVPLDGSRFSEAALPAAIRFARRHRTEVRLLTVVDPALVFGGDSAWEFVDTEHADDVRTGASRYMKRLRARLDSLLPGLTTRVREGYPADEIRAEAGEFDADLVVMATHGRGGFSRLWLGSVANQFVRHSDRPVLLVRAHEGESMPPGSLDTRRLVLPLDGSEHAEHALGWAIGIAAAFGSEIRMVRMIHNLTVLDAEFFPDTVARTDQILAQESADALAYLEAVARPLRDWGLAVSAHADAAAEAASGILAEADNDLIVIATHGRTGLKRALLGSVTDGVLRGASGPVLVIPPRAAENGGTRAASRRERAPARKTSEPSPAQRHAR